MKTKILFSFLLLGLVFSANAQEISKNALGLRLGDNDGFGGEISYQRGLSDNNRLEVDLGWRNSSHVDAFKLTGLYQWVWNIEGGFNWYAGVGGGLGSWSVDEKYGDGSGTFFFAAGDIGIEYLFDFPLQLSLDFRPELYLNNNGDNQFREKSFGPDIALGVRYRF
jgi:hypothetical protein